MELLFTYFDAMLNSKQIQSIASPKFILVMLILTSHMISITHCQHNCTAGVKIIPECGVVDWQPWDCSLCATQYETMRKRGICCPSKAGKNQTLCLELCKIKTKVEVKVEETKPCPQQCKGYTDTTTIKTTRQTTLHTTTIQTTLPTTKKATTLPTPTIQTTLPTTTKTATLSTTTYQTTLPTTTKATTLPTTKVQTTLPTFTRATTILPTTKQTTLPTTIKTTTVQPSHRTRTTLPTSNRIANPTTSGILPLAPFIATTTHLSDERISQCMTECVSSDNIDGCIEDCMGVKFNTFCKILSLSLLFAGLLLGLIIMAVICTIKRKKEAKYNRIVTPERVVTTLHAQPIMNVTYGDENRINKYPLSDFHGNQSSRLPKQSPRHFQSIPTRSPRQAAGNTLRNIHMIDAKAWKIEERSINNRLPIDGYSQNKTDNFSGDYHKNKYPLSDFDANQPSRLPKQSPRNVQNIPTKSPRQAAGNTLSRAWNVEERSINNRLPIDGYSQNKTDNFYSKPKALLEDLLKQPRAELGEHFNAGSETLSRMNTPSTRITEMESRSSDIHIGPDTSRTRTTSSIRPELQRMNMLHDRVM